MSVPIYHYNVYIREISRKWCSTEPTSTKLNSYQILTKLMNCALFPLRFDLLHIRLRDQGFIKLKTS